MGKKARQGAGAARRRDKPMRTQRARRGRAGIYAAALVLALAAAATAYLARPAGRLPSEAAAPAFSLPDTEGRQVSLASLQGKPVVLVFFRTFG